VEKKQIVVKAIMIPFFGFLNKKRRNYDSILKRVYFCGYFSPAPSKIFHLKIAADSEIF